MRNAIIGGAFDPVTTGHTAISKPISWIMDRVVFMPSKSHADKTMTAASHRLAMLDIATVQLESNVFVESFELDNDFGCQTYDVMNAMKKHYLGDELFFVMGQDAADKVLWEWHNGRKFIDETRCIVIPRTGYSSEIPEKEQWYRMHDHTFLEDVVLSPISSTAVRQLLKKRDGRAAEFLHPEVYEYIVRNELYL